jgi:serine/threonine protein kinase
VCFVRLTGGCRAPELLLDEPLYTPAVDVWSLGCIFAEFILREPLFRGRDDFDQLRVISEACAVPRGRGAGGTRCG